MSDADSTLAEFRRYAGMISAAMKGPISLDASVEGTAAVQIERGLLFATIVRDGPATVRDAWVDLASDAFGRLPRSQQESGEFLASGPSDNPDARVYDELVLLHAAADYAVQAEDRPVAAAVARAGEFHLRQTQPDHATG